MQNDIASTIAVYIICYIIHSCNEQPSLCAWVFMWNIWWRWHYL